MKALIVLATLCTVALTERDVSILKQESTNRDGVFRYVFETGDGTSAQVEGDANSHHGQFQFTSPEGETFQVSYVADENGYHPTGAHIHDIPEPIARALEWIRSHPPRERK